MKKILLLALVCTLGFAYSSKASSIYQVNDNAIEAALSTATPVALQVVSDAASLLSPMAIQAKGSDKNVWIAVILELIAGGIAVHRVYLGSKPVMIFYYLI